jgi:transmembrane sensor
MKERGVDSQQIEAAAAGWIIRRQADDWSDVDESQLNQWLAESVAHRVAYIRLDSVWRDTGRLRALGAGIPRGTIPPPKSHHGVAQRPAKRRP